MGVHDAMCLFIDNIAKYANFHHIGAREVGFGLIDDREDGEHNGDSVVEISKIITMRNAFLEQDYLA